MTNEVKIEHYLLQLDQALIGLPVSQRAEIITEIKSHIHESLEKDPAATVDRVLASLGSATQVAERYYVAKGMTAPRMTSRPRQILKWAMVTVALFIGFIFLATAGTIWYFSPLISATGHHVAFFNGHIDIDDSLGRVRIGNLQINGDHESAKIDGETDLSGSSVKTVRIPFNTAKLDIDSSADNVLHWHCKGPSGFNTKAEVNVSVLTLDLAALNAAKCTISLPVGVATELTGNNSKMNIQAGNQPLDIKVNNGKIDIHPDHSRVYDFEVAVQNGVTDEFPHSQAKDAVKIKVSVQNGVVKQE